LAALCEFSRFDPIDAARAVGSDVMKMIMSKQIASKASSVADSERANKV